MVKDFNIDTVAIDGKYSKFFWDYNINKNATIANALANCTTLVYGACIAAGLGAPVSTIRDARNWHKNLTENWEVIPYSRKSVKENDILEWTTNHVAIAIDGNNVTASWYTGMNGKAYDGEEYSKRDFSSLKDLSNWMKENYPYRFCHTCTVEQEIKSLGNVEPAYILRRKSSGGNKEIKEALDEISKAIEKIKEAV